MGIDYGVKQLAVGDQKLHLYFFDLAGGPDYTAVREGFYQTAHAAVLMYDTSRPDTFLNLTHWLNEANSNGGRIEVCRGWHMTCPAIMRLLDLHMIGLSALGLAKLRHVPDSCVWTPLALGISKMQSDCCRLSLSLQMFDREHSRYPRKADGNGRMDMGCTSWKSRWLMVEAWIMFFTGPLMPC